MNLVSMSKKRGSYQMVMASESCFIRIGSSVESMNSKTILSLFSKRTRYLLKNMKIPKQDLEFNILRICYRESGN